MGNCKFHPMIPILFPFFVNARAIFTVIGALVLQPAEARHINFVAGLQFFRRVGRSWLWCGILAVPAPWKAGVRKLRVFQ